MRRGFCSKIILFIHMTSETYQNFDGWGRHDAACPRASEPHDHGVLRRDGGAVMHGNDPRRFGRIGDIERGREAAHPRLARVGPDPLPPGFDGACLSRAPARKLKRSSGAPRAAAAVFPDFDPCKRLSGQPASMPSMGADR
jgi:formamidopyrimidine-DNA glycosylase